MATSFQQVFPIPPNLPPLVIWQALEWLGWGVGGTPDGSVFTGEIGMSLFSWGEKITVTRVAPQLLSISSACVFPLQWFDWGKNEKNVHRLYEVISAIGQGLPPR